MLKLSNNVTLPAHELELTHIRAQGNGGQKVNKTSSAVQLRFNYLQSQALPDFYKQQLAQLSDSRITKAGDIIIKAQAFRSQEQNREDALARLATLLRDAAKVERKRIATRPTLGSKKRRLLGKSQNNGWGGMQCVWASHVLQVLVGALEVPGSHVANNTQFSGPIVKTNDGFLEFPFNPTDKEHWRFPPGRRDGCASLSPLSGPFVGPMHLAWKWLLGAPENWPAPSCPRST